MSSAAAGGTNQTSGDHNEAFVTGEPGTQAEFSATSAVSAEAQQGDGPAAASASGSGSSGQTVETVAVAVSCNADFAVAACPIAVVAVGINSASAASENGVVSVGLEGAAATSNSANASETTMRSYEGLGFGDDRAITRMLSAVRSELSRLSADTEQLKAEMAAHDEQRAVGAPAGDTTKAEAAQRDKRTGAAAKPKPASDAKPDGPENDGKPGGSGKTPGGL